jgi:uncharacterized protein YaaW (UPF0174 family)
VTTLTGKFLEEILKKRDETIADDEFLSETEKIINKIISANGWELKNETDLGSDTTINSDLMKEILLKALEKLKKTEIDKDVLVEVEKMLQVEKSTN